jgi:sulfatase modifying factor 1
MVSIFVKDDLRASVEAASGGRQTVLYTALGQPTYMNVIPQFDAQAVDAALPPGPHEMFMVNGIAKSEYFVGTYPGRVVNGELLSLPGMDPSTGINHDQAVAFARANGVGHHLMTNAAFAGIALWCRANGIQPRGNTNLGRSGDAIWETARRADGLSPGTSGGAARTLTGSGPVSWRHDNTSAGISDLCGNTWEWTPGIRLMGGEIQIIAGNNAVLSSTDLSSNSAEWKAINGATGTLMVPTFTGSIAAGTYLPTTANSVRLAENGAANYTLVRASGQSFEAMTNPGATPVGAAALALLKSLGLFPVAKLLGGTIAVPAENGDGIWFALKDERLAFRGGSWSDGNNAGLFAMGMGGARTQASADLCGRPAFVL